MLRAIILAVVSFWMCVSAHAHDPGLSTARASLSRDALNVILAFAPSDVAALLADGGSAPKLDDTTFDSLKLRLLVLAPKLWEARSGGASLQLIGLSAVLLPENNLEIHLSFARPPPGKLILCANALNEFPPGHREYTTYIDETGELIAEKLLSEKDPSLEVAVAQMVAPDIGDSEAMPSFWGFLKLGIEHILTGYDHLLFLFGLLVVCRRWHSIVAIISCFTVAHSLTLALATLNIIQVSSRIIEPCIAASIVFVGVENLVRKGAEPKGRWALTFAFGLIHGFGFATVLRELGAGEGGHGLLMPLFTFNFGVEVGQILVAAIFLPILWQLHKKPMFMKRGIPILSAAVAIAGLYWFLERTLFAS